MEINESIAPRVIKGGFWIFLLRFTERILSIVKLIILARILAPHDFGLMGIALLTVSILDTFSEPGFRAALVQKKENIRPYLDSAWTFLIIRGFILFIILYFSAPYAAIFFKSPQATHIIQVSGFSRIIGVFANIGCIYLQKEWEFNKIFIYRISTSMAEFIVAISCALVLRNVWALVFGLLAAKLVGLILSYIIHPYRPHLDFNLRKAKELFGFGKWILGSSVLIFLITQGDDIFVGKFLGAAALGLYQMAYRISNMPATEITHVISQVTFPAYSKMQDNIPRLREAYLRVLRFTSFLSFPIAGLIFVLAPDFTKIFLGEKWLPMVPAMKVLVIWGAIRSIGATTGPVFQAVGKPKILTKLQFWHLIALVISIYPLSARWGILGTSWAVVIAVVIPVLAAFYLTIKVLKCKIQKFFETMGLPLINMVFIILLISFLKICFTNNTRLLVFFYIFLSELQVILA